MASNITDKLESVAHGTSLLQTIQTDVKGSLDSFMKEKESIDPDSFQLSACFEPVATQENLIGTVSVCAVSLTANSKFIPRPLSELAQLSPKLVKKIGLGYRCYRFSIIDETLWFIQHGTSNINILDLEGNKMRTVTFNEIGALRAVAKITSDLITVATAKGLYQTKMDGQQPNCIVHGDMADVTTLGDKVYALERNQKIVHVLQLKRQDNSLVVVKQVNLENMHANWLNAIVATSDSLYLSEYCGHAITHFSTDSTAIEKFGIQGSGIGELNYPVICGIDENGCLLITDQFNNRLQILNNGTWTAMTVDGLTNPVWAGFIKNTLYVSEGSSGKLKIYTYA